MTFPEAITIIIGLPVAGAIFLPTVAMNMYHKRKMEELRQKEQRLVSADILSEFEKIRTEIRELRDVTMQYDLSFDTALQQVEHRLAHLERPHYGQQAADTAQESPLRTRHG